MERKEEIALELKSESMNEMLSQPPGWIIRSGSTLFLSILFLALCLAWFIRYPDEVDGDVVVTRSKAPIELSNQSYIQLKRLNVVENQQVQVGDLIAQFDLRVSAADLESATTYLDRLGLMNLETLTKIPEFHGKLQLGIYQEQWTDLLSKIHEWNVEHAENISSKELAFIEREIFFREQLQDISGRKISLSESEYTLVEEQLESSERLAGQHAISKQVLAQDRRSRNQFIQSVQGQKEQHVQNLIALNSLRKEKLRLGHDAKIDQLQKAAEIRMNLETLRNSFQNWEKNAAWIAPCSGKIVFNKLLQVNRFYKPNEASVVIVPFETDHSAIASVVSSGAGKLKVGQKAFIELVDYPKAEFGLLEGKVSGMTQIDKDGKYELRIDLLQPLKTTYNKSIPPKAQLKGKVKIVTKDKRLLMRFFERLTNLIK